MVAACLAAHWLADRHRSAFLRRACRHDAESGRPIHLPTRVVLATLGIPLRLDATVGDSNRHDCRGGRGFWALSWNFMAGYRRDAIHHSARPHHHRIRTVAIDRATGRRAGDRPSHMDQLPGPALRKMDSKRIHDSEARHHGRADLDRPVRGVEFQSRQRQLRRFVDAARL